MKTTSIPLYQCRDCGLLYAEATVRTMSTPARCPAVRSVDPTDRCDGSIEPYGALTLPSHILPPESPR